MTGKLPAGRKDPAYPAFVSERRSFWDRQAKLPPAPGRASRYYHHRLEEIYRFLVAPGLRVLELGCGLGDLLASLEPEEGVGVDFSEEMIRRASERHPRLRFLLVNAEDLEMEERFDVIIISDLVNDLWDIQAVLERCRKLCHPGTRIILNCFSRLWQLPLGLARRAGLAQPVLEQNWVTVGDLRHLLNLAGFEALRSWSDILWPFPTPVVTSLMNRYLARMWPFREAALTNFVVARPQPRESDSAGKPAVSVIVAARNEAGNIGQLLARTPEMGGGTEIIFVEGHSTDGTYETIEKEIAGVPGRGCRLYRQPGRGKGDAVRFGFAKAEGAILMILDADLSVPPEELPRFYQALVSGRGEFINGVRLVYPMEKKAMRFFNVLGNKFFSLAFSTLLGQSIKDTLCGTKVIWKKDYERLERNRAYFGDFDPFGDFDLIFGAAKLNLKIVDMPVRYRERTYGSTNIHRWRHGVLLLKMVLFAARRIKFV